jgi:hypothetical protein
MSAAKTQLIGGKFQDSEGNLLINGYLRMFLSADEVVTGVGSICSGIFVQIQLDSNGSVASSSSTPPASNQFIWSNDVMTPVNSYYRVFGYAANGQLAWGPNNQQVIFGSGIFDVGTWIPNSVISWQPPIQPVTLQTNEVNNGSQTILDLHAGSGITLTDNGSGQVTVASSVASLVLETNGTPNSSQTLLNLAAGTGVTLSNTAGTTTINSTQSGPRPSRGNWHGWSWIGGNSATLTGASVNAYSDSPTTAGASDTNTSINPTSTEPAYFQTTTNASSGLGTSGVYSGGGSNEAGGFTVGILTDFQERVKVSDTVGVRYWIGAIDVTVSAPIGANTLLTNTPLSSFIGFRYSSLLDAHWQCVTNTSGTQTVVDSGVSVDTAAGHIFEFQSVGNGAVITFYIDSVLVATISTNIPVTNLRAITTVDNSVAATKSISVAYVYWETRV